MLITLVQPTFLQFNRLSSAIFFLQRASRPFYVCHIDLSTKKKKT